MLRACLADGRLSYSKVRELTRVAEPDSQQDLIEIAEHATAAQVERVVRAWCRSNQRESLEAAQLQYQNRKLESRVGENGTGIITIQLPIDDHKKIMAAINAKEREYAKTERQQAKQRAASENGGPVDDVPRGMSNDLADPIDRVYPFWFTPADKSAQRRVDAFLELWNTPVFA